MDSLVTPRHEPEYPEEHESDTFMDESNSRKLNKGFHSVCTLKRLH